MSRGLDRAGEQREEKLDGQSRMNLTQDRVGGGGETEDDRAHGPQEDYLAHSEQRTLTHEREEVRYRRHGYEWSATERVVIRKTVASVHSTREGAGRELSAEVLAL